MRVLAGVVKPPPRPCARLPSHARPLSSTSRRPLLDGAHAHHVLQVADFGLARSMTDLELGGEQFVMTDYVATRWYRAPEILLGSTTYGFGVDMWGLGCILGEILMAKPIFPGSSTINQLETIMEVTGQPGDLLMKEISPFATAMMESVSFRQLPTYSGAQTIAAANEPTAKRWQVKFPSASPDALNLLYQLLHIDHNKRIDAVKALEHPYVATFHDVSTERLAPRIVTVPISDADKKSTAVYRERLYHEVTKAKRSEGTRMQYVRDARDCGHE